VKRKNLILALIIFFLIFIPYCKKYEEETGETLSYPLTKTVEQVDDYFGVKVKDPYRWMEDDQSEEVKQWVEVQNKLTFSYLERIPFREAIKRRVSEVYNYPKCSAPFRAGEYYFFYKNDGLQNQSVIYIKKGLEGKEEVFLDPNKLSEDGTVRIDLISFSRDDRYVVYSQSEAGSDWRELRVMEIESRKELDDRIRWVKFTDAAWFDDGFFYSGFDRPEEGKELSEANKFQKIFYHRLNSPQEKDTLVYEDPLHPLRYKRASITEDGRFLILSISEGTHGNELYSAKLGQGKIEFKPLIQGFEFNSSVIDNIGSKFLVYTNADAPNYKLVLLDPENPEKENWEVVIPEREEALTGVGSVGERIFCSYLKDATTRVYEYELDGKLVREIEMPALGSASGFYGKKEDNITFYTFESFMIPPVIYKYDLQSGKSEVYFRTQVPFNPEDYVVKQVFYSSKDGTRVPMFIVHRKGLKLNGKNPTLLYAYGGFNISMVPRFDPTIVVILENGGVYAMPNIRGGGEYGEKWHRGGMLLNKQNVFDDFIAAAEYLINEKYTSKERLAISGASNGGLLVGASMTQRPELFKVAFPAVGVMDMLRFHKFTVGWGWVVEYGSSETEEHFRNLYSYSPLHNIKEGVSYPATLVTTADHDDRVVPAHSYKFIATLQKKHKGTNPVLIRIETRSGHGASSTSKRIEEIADKFAFMFFNMKIKPKY